MKALLILLVLCGILFTQAMAQNEICKERGHVLKISPGTTLMMSHTYTVDLPDKTIRIHDDPNGYTTYCTRCDYSVFDNSPDTTVVWERPLKYDSTWDRRMEYLHVDCGNLLKPSGLMRDTDGIIKQVYFCNKCEVVELKP